MGLHADTLGVSYHTPTKFFIRDVPVVYGRSFDDHLAIERGLREASSSLPDLRGLDFSSSRIGVRASSYSSRDAHSLDLDWLRPYLPHLEPKRLARLIHHALNQKTHYGNLPAAFSPKEDEFLKKFIPLLVRKKLEARHQKAEPVSFEVKVLGLGIYAEEFPELLRRFMRELDLQSETPVPVLAILNGFDYCVRTSSMSVECLGSSSDVAARSRYHQAKVNLNLHYGDLTYEDGAEIMLGYGRPDLTVWRRTWVLANSFLSKERAQQMRSLIAGNSNRPGGFIMHEPCGRNGEFCFQENYR